MSDYDVTIERKNETKLYFNLADGLGRPSRTRGSFKMSQFPRQALKMQQGDTQHSDREPPYASIEQRDFAGGRGWDRLDRDKTRFYDSYRMQTWMNGVVMLGPEETYASGIRDTEIRHWWKDNIDSASEIFKVTLDGSYEYISYKFTPEADIDPAYVYLAVGVDSHLANWLFSADIYSDDGGKPDAKIFGTGDITPIAYEMITRLEFDSPSTLTNGTTYHLVVRCSTVGGDPGNTDYGYHIFCSDTVPANTAYKSSDGSSWSSFTKGIFFRLVEEEEDFEIFPFEHLGALYMALSFYDGSDPRIFRNGERGTVTSATSNTLTDSGAGWTVDEWAGCIAKIYSGTGADAEKPWRLIESNTADTLTLESDWDIDSDETTKYTIIQSDKYTEIIDHEMIGRITDVCVYANIVYFAKGDFSDIYHMYDDTFTLEAGNRGSFILVAPSSSTGEMQVYLTRASFPPAVLSADPVFADDGVAIEDLNFSQAVEVGDSNCEADDGSWADYNGPTFNTQSMAQKKDGRYSRRIVAAGANQGAGQTLSGLSIGTIYHVEGYIYNSGANEAAIEFDGTELDSIATTGSWIYVHGYKATTSETPTLRFISKTGACTFFFDSVKVSQVETPLPVGHNKITGMVIAGEPRRLYVLTDAGVIRENYGFFRDVSPGEFISARDDRNGSTSAKTGADIYLSFLDNVCKYYDEKITIIGPNLNDEGLPEERRGDIAHMIMYGEWLLAAIDGGSSNTSSILLYNKLGWHEYYRAPAAGLRITKLFIQPMPGTNVDRLWFNEGADLVWLPIDLNPDTNGNYRYCPIGWVDMSTVYGSISDLEKFFHKIRIAADNLGVDNNIYIRTAPRDEDGYYDTEIGMPAGETYQTIWGDFTTGPVDERSIDEFWSMEDFTLKRLQIHLSISSDSSERTAKIRAIVIDYMEYLPVAWSYTMRLVTMDRRKSLTGEVQEADAEDDILTLMGYVDSAEPVRIYTPFGVAAVCRVKLTAITDIEPVGYSRRGEKEKYTFTLAAADA